MKYLFSNLLIFQNKVTQIKATRIRLTTKNLNSTQDVLGSNLVILIVKKKTQIISKYLKQITIIFLQLYVHIIILYKNEKRRKKLF